MFTALVSKALSLPGSPVLGVVLSFYFTIARWLKMFVSALSFKFVLLSIVVGLALFLRVVNLNYNSPFSDEAIYVVVGQLGLFFGDWFSLNTGNWLSGSQYAYPLVSGIAYAIGGIVGTRFLSAIAGTILVVLGYALTLTFLEGGKKALTSKSKTERAKTQTHTLYRLLGILQPNRQIIAALVTAFLVAGSTTGLYVSRLATMDSIAFVFLFMSLFLLQKELNKGDLLKGRRHVSEINGQLFFVSSLFLALSALIKLTTLFYFPLFVIYGLVASSKIQRRLFISYYVIPLILLTLVYVFYNFVALENFALLQAGRERSSLTDIWETIWQSLNYLSPFAIIGLLFTPFAISVKKWMFLLIAAFWIIAIHLVELRVFTLDKHLNITVIFLSIIAGIGISFGLSLLSKFRLHLAGYVLLTICLLNYFLYSYVSLGEFNKLWTNSDPANQYLQAHVVSGDKVLSESGASTILDLFKKIGIANITTFDYLKYQNIEGETAYVNAVKDGYFRYIELESEQLPKTASVAKMHKLIKDNMDDNYELAYEKNGLQIYRRAF